MCIKYQNPDPESNAEYTVLIPNHNPQPLSMLPLHEKGASTHFIIVAFSYVFFTVAKVSVKGKGSLILTVKALYLL